MVLDIKKEFTDIRDMYTKDASRTSFNALLIGKFGTGKTYSLKTCRGPVLVDCFDPGGAKTIEDATKSGLALVRYYDKEDPKNPTEYDRWEATFERNRREGLFKEVGTYVIDSATMWVAALSNKTAKRFARPDNVLQIQDYNLLQMIFKNVLAACTSLPCDFILTGHIESVKDETTGRMEAAISLIPSLQKFLPLLFDEVYVTLTKETSKGVEYFFLTANTGMYQARTRLGAGGKFELYERPDFKGLLKKVGFPTEDKPFFNI